MSKYTQAQLNALRSALASGLTRASYDGKSVEYRDLNELREAIEIIEADLDGRTRRRTFYLRASGDKGL